MRECQPLLMHRVLWLMFALHLHSAAATALQMTPLSPLNPAAAHAACGRAGMPARAISFPHSRPLRPFGQPKPALSLLNGLPARQKKTKIIEAPASCPGGNGFFVLNLTNDELARRD